MAVARRQRGCSALTVIARLSCLQGALVEGLGTKGSPQQFSLVSLPFVRASLISGLRTPHTRHG